MNLPSPQNNSNNDNLNAIMTPSLPQHDNPLVQAERKIQLEVSRKIYGYEQVPGLPMPLASNTAAAAEALILLKESDWFKGQVENQLGIFVNLKIWEILSQHQQNNLSFEDYQNQISQISKTSLFQELTSSVDDLENPLAAISALADRLNRIETASEPEFSNLAAYAKVFNLYQTPDITGIWQDDKIFSSQRLAGLNPMAIQLVSPDGKTGVSWGAIRQKLSPAISDEAVKHFLGPNASFSSAIAEKRLFVCDYAALKHAKAAPDALGAQKGQILLGPIALFVLTADCPVPQLAAIQIDQAAPGQTDNQFASMMAVAATQPGNANKWILAKMFIQAADINFNQAVNHLGETHLVEEAFALATHRHLALQHPLYILLSHHFEALMVINKLGQLTLLNKEGLIQKILEGGLSGSLTLIQNAYAAWEFADLDFPDRIISRGLDTEVLSYFPYRDDGQLIWDVLKNYVTEYLRLYYKSDEDVTHDYELQSWAQELASAEFAHIKGFADSIQNLDELVTITLRLIWTAGPQHAAVNFPQIEYAAFIPNLPAATYTPAPENFNQGPVGDADLLKLLPPGEQTSVQVKTTYALAGFHFNSLLDYYDKLDAAPRGVCKKYHDILRNDISKEITARNTQREAQQGLLPYPYFLPDNIPNSTSV